MSEKTKKYIIRYKFGELMMSEKWNYSTKILDDGTYSVFSSTNPSIIKMTLKEAEKNVIKIKEIRKLRKNEIKEIQIIDTETNEIVIYKPRRVSRFELMEI